MLNALFAASLAACGGGDDDDNNSNPPPAFQVSIVSPAVGASVARGEGAPGAGSFNGTGFSINLEIVTRDSASVAARENTNVRDVTRLGPGQLEPADPGGELRPGPHQA